MNAYSNFRDKYVRHATDQQGRPAPGQSVAVM